EPPNPAKYFSERPEMTSHNEKSRRPKQRKRKYENKNLETNTQQRCALPVFRCRATGGRRGGGARAIRARRFRSERQRFGWRRPRPTRRQGSHRRQLYNALRQRWKEGHAKPHCPTEPRRHTRRRLQPKRDRRF